MDYSNSKFLTKKNKRDFGLTVVFLSLFVVGVLFFLNPVIVDAKSLYRVSSDGDVTLVSESVPDSGPVLKSAFSSQIDPIRNEDQLNSPTFNVYFDDVTTNTGIGFDDPTNGSARRDAAQRVVDYLGTIITNTGVCDISFLASSNNPDSTILGSGGTYYWSDSGLTNGLAWDHITTGIDPYDGASDIEVTINFGKTWYAGTDSTPAGQYDLASVILHEITHGFGIVSLISNTGASKIASGVYSHWDSYMLTGTGGVYQVTGTPPAFNGLTTDLTGGRGGLFTVASTTVSTYGSQVPIYTPTTYNSGGSLSHLASTATGNPVMQYSIATGVSRRTYADYEISMLADINYSVSSDQTAPVVTAFVIPENVSSTSLTVPITTFTATDAVGVAGYLVNESSSTPALGDSNWEVTTTTSYTFLSAGTKTLYAWAKDEAGNISVSVNDSVMITAVIPNLPPNVSLDAPADGSSATVGDVVSLTATADDADGSVSSVKFYSNNTLLSTDDSSPYTYSWTPSSAGTYSLVAVATDDDGDRTTSTLASVTVSAAVVTPPPSSGGGGGGGGGGSYVPPIVPVLTTTPTSTPPSTPNIIDNGENEVNTPTTVSPPTVLPYKNNVLLRDSQSGRVYLIVNSQKQYISTLAELKTLIAKYKLYSVNSSVLNLYSNVGTPTTVSPPTVLPYKNNVLLRDAKSGKVFKILNGKKRYVSTIAELKNLLKQHYKMYSVSGSVIELYSTY